MDGLIYISQMSQWVNLLMAWMNFFTSHIPLFLHPEQTPVSYENSVRQVFEAVWEAGT